MTKLEYIELRILELTARKEAAENYCMNTKMQIEATLLKAQIDALVQEHLKINAETAAEKIMDAHIREYGW